MGGAGDDTVHFDGETYDYTYVKLANGSVIVTDNGSNGWGSDLFSGVEAFQFANGVFSYEALFPTSPPVTLPAPDPNAPDTVYGNSASNDLYGYGGNDRLHGNNGNDRLYGGDGNDIFFGGAGKDTLTGGAGKDIFAFNTKLSRSTNIDKITDFKVVDDSIWLDNAIFKMVGKGTEASPKS